MISNQKGSAVIETAIALPIFIFLLVAIVDFGLYFNKRNVAQSAAYNAAKECVTTAGTVTLDSDSIGGKTLATMDLLSSVNMAEGFAPFCDDQSGTTGYYQVNIRIKGNMMSPFTSWLGLYSVDKDKQGLLVTGIASK